MKRSITAALALVSAGAFAQISFTGNYSEDFNTWPNEESPGVIEGAVLPWTNNITKVGWYQGRRPSGTMVANTQLGIGNGEGGLNTLISLGMIFDTDRGIGSGNTSSATSGTNPIFWGFQLANNTGATVQAVDIRFDVENWRRPQTIDPTFSEQNTTFGQYRVGGTDFRLFDFVDAPNLNLVSLSPSIGASDPINGNLAENRYQVSTSLTGLNWQAGESLWIRWQDANNLGFDAILGIDNLSVVTAPVPEPASLLLLGAGASWLTLRRKKRA